MITVLRLGHRLGRDARISTHCGLAARALGANKIIYSGDKDESLIESVKDVAERWGGSFKVEYEKNWKEVTEKYKKRKYAIIHLTVYGLPVQNEVRKLRKNKNMLIIIGGEKVPPEVYDLSDCNISVTNQPHSEVASLAILLHEYHKGKELEKRFGKARIRVVPQKKGKKVIG